MKKNFHDDNNLIQTECAEYEPWGIDINTTDDRWYESSSSRSGAEKYRGNRRS